MIVKSFEFNNKSGVQLSRAVKFVNAIDPYESRVMLRNGDSEYNAKSVLSLMSALSRPHLDLAFLIEGKDEEIVSKIIDETLEKIANGVIWQH